MTGRARHLVLLGPLLLLGVGLAAERAEVFTLFRFAVQRTPGLMPSSRVMPEREVARGLPIVSVVVAQEDLHDPATGILANVEGRGRAWERPATVSIFDEGELRLASGAGLRVHGGGSRRTSPRQGFRLHFRPRYGRREIETRLVFDRDVGPRRTLVVHNDVRPDQAGREWHFINPLAYDIARRIGSPTVETRPVRFFLNGDLQGVYVLTERADQEFLRSRFGDTRIRGTAPEDVPLARALWAWLEAQPALTMDVVSMQVDVDSLTRWFLTVLFCATVDVFQAPGQVFDPARSSGGWFWIIWDLDQSFMDLKVHTRTPWLRDTFDSVLVARPDRGVERGEPRARLLATLLQDARYREFFKTLFTKTMNHRLTREFLDERYDYYARIATTYGVDDTSYLPILRQFLRERPAVLRAQVAQRMNAGRTHALRVTVPPGVQLLVDEEPIGSAYEGLYFTGTTVTLRTRHPAKGAVQHWVVNGEVTAPGAGVLTLRLAEDTAIELVAAPVRQQARR